MLLITQDAEDAKHSNEGLFSSHGFSTKGQLAFLVQAWKVNTFFVVQSQLKRILVSFKMDQPYQFLVIHFFTILLGTLCKQLPAPEKIRVPCHGTSGKQM